MAAIGEAGEGVVEGEIAETATGVELLENNVELVLDAFPVDVGEEADEDEGGVGEEVSKAKDRDGEGAEHDESAELDDPGAESDAGAEGSAEGEDADGAEELGVRVMVGEGVEG